MSSAPKKKAKVPGGLAQRAVTGVVLAVLVLAVIWLPEAENFSWLRGDSLRRNLDTPFTSQYFRFTGLFALLAAAMVAVGFREFVAMVRAKNVYAEATGGTVAVFAIVLCACTGNAALVNTAVFIAAAMLAWLHILRGMLFHTLPGLAATIFGVFYLGWMPAHLVLMHAIPEFGPGIVTMLIAMVAMSDTGAYFTGRAIGKHKLAPHTSPKKTWEGAAGGLLAAMLTGAAIYLLRAKFQFDDLPDYSLLWFLATGAVLSVVSQIGDLVESMLKRDAGIKDSGNIFPGHGGVLDRCDGILFAAPALYYLLQLEQGLAYMRTGLGQ